MFIVTQIIIVLPNPGILKDLLKGFACLAVRVERVEKHLWQLGLLRPCEVRWTLVCAALACAAAIAIPLQVTYPLVARTTIVCPQLISIVHFLREEEPNDSDRAAILGDQVHRDHVDIDPAMFIHEGNPSRVLARVQDIPAQLR